MTVKQRLKVITLTMPGTLRQDSPTKIIAAGIPKEEIFAEIVAIAAHLRDRLQVLRLTSAPTHQALLAIRAVCVGEAAEEVAFVEADPAEDVPSVLVSQAIHL